MTLAIERIDHIVLNVKDVEASVVWYEQVLGMQREDFDSRTGKRVSVKFGQQKINLRPADHDTGSWPTGVNTGAGAGDVCFITAIPPLDVIAHLHDCGVQILQGPVERAGEEIGEQDPLDLVLDEALGLAVQRVLAHPLVRCIELVPRLGPLLIPPKPDLRQGLRVEMGDHAVERVPVATQDHRISRS